MRIVLVCTIQTSRKNTSARALGLGLGPALITHYPTGTVKYAAPFVWDTVDAVGSCELGTVTLSSEVFESVRGRVT